MSYFPQPEKGGHPHGEKHEPLKRATCALCARFRGCLGGHPFRVVESNYMPQETL